MKGNTDLEKLEKCALPVNDCRMSLLKAAKETETNLWFVHCYAITASLIWTVQNVSKIM